MYVCLVAKTSVIPSCSVQGRYVFKPMLRVDSQRQDMYRQSGTTFQKLDTDVDCSVDRNVAVQ